MKRRSFIKYVTLVYGLFSIDLSAYEIGTEERKVLKTNKKENKQQNKLCIVGVGGGGSNIISDIQKIDPKNHYISINSDVQALKASKIKHTIALNSYDNLGCGKKLKCGKKLFYIDEKKQLSNLVQSYEKIIIVTSLGGGTGGGTTPEIIKFLQNNNKDVSVSVTLPFSFEGTQRTKQALEALRKIKKISNSVCVIENDVVLKSANSRFGIKKSFFFLSTIVYKQILS